MVEVQPYARGLSPQLLQTSFQLLAARATSRHLDAMYNDWRDPIPGRANIIVLPKRLLRLALRPEGELSDSTGVKAVSLGLSVTTFGLQVALDQVPQMPTTARTAAELAVASVVGVGSRVVLHQRQNAWVNRELSYVATSLVAELLDSHLGTDLLHSQEDLGYIRDQVDHAYEQQSRDLAALLTADEGRRFAVLDPRNDVDQIRSAIRVIETEAHAAFWREPRGVGPGISAAD